MPIMFNLRGTEVVMYNISSIKESTGSLCRHINILYYIRPSEDILGINS